MMLLQLNCTVTHFPKDMQAFILYCKDFLIFIKQRIRTYKKYKLKMQNRKDSHKKHLNIRELWCRIFTALWCIVYGAAQ